MAVSPLVMQMAIAFHATGEPEQFFTPLSWGSPASEAAREWLLLEGLIVDGESGDIRGTEKLAAWLEAALSTPLPVQKWVIER